MSQGTFGWVARGRLDAATRRVNRAPRAAVYSSMAPRTRPGLLRPLRDETAFVRTLGSSREAIEPLRAILDLGFAVHDVTSRGIEIVCPMPSPTRRTEAARKVAGAR